MKLLRPRVNEVHSVYIDNLDEWIEIPVYITKDVEKIIKDVDFEGMTLVEYKKLMIETIDLEPKIRNQITSYAVRDEIYNFIIAKNPGLQFKNRESVDSIYTAVESKAVLNWFASGGNTGTKPEVIHGEI